MALHDQSNNATSRQVGLTARSSRSSSHSGGRNDKSKRMPFICFQSLGWRINLIRLAELFLETGVRVVRIDYGNPEGELEMIARVECRTVADCNSLLAAFAHALSTVPYFNVTFVYVVFPPFLLIDANFTDHMYMCPLLFYP